MVLKGKDEWENLSRAGGPREAEPRRFGETVVPSSVAWALKPVGKSPALRAEYVLDANGDPVCVSLHIDATKDGRGITLGDLMYLSLDSKGRDGFLHFASRVPTDNEQTLREKAALLTSTPDLSPASVSRHAEVAEVYIDAVNRGEHPTKAVQEHFGLLDRRQARRWVEKAEGAGYVLPGRGEAR